MTGWKNKNNTPGARDPWPWPWPHGAEHPCYMCAEERQRQGRPALSPEIARPSIQGPKYTWRDYRIGVRGSAKPREGG